MPTILVAGRSGDTHTHIIDILQTRGYTVILADNEANQRADLVLIDLSSPGQDAAGELVAAREPAFVGNPPVVLLTNAGQKPDLPLPSIDAWLTDAFDDHELLGCVRALLQARAGPNQLREIDDLRRRLRQTEQQRAALEEAERKKDEFISLISHELKNPMASIKGYADLMRRRLNKTPNDPNRKGLEIISQQVGRMTAMLDQLLDFSRINMDRLRLDTRPTDLVAVVQQVIDDVRPATAQRSFHTEIASDSIPIKIDVARISQAIHNLLINAVKFSPEGTVITVRVGQRAAPQQLEAIISVSDQGVGIPVDQHQRIFERFYRANNIAESTAGLGVGLFIAKEIVTRHGGRILVESEEGQGATFTVALPVVTS